MRGGRECFRFGARCDLPSFVGERARDKQKQERQKDRDINKAKHGGVREKVSKVSRCM